MAQIQRATIARNSTGNIISVFVSDGAGKGVTGIAETSVNLRSFKQGEAGAGTTANPVVGAIDTFVSDGWVEVDATNLAGFYQYSIPNAFIQSTSSNLILSFEIAGAGNQNIVYEVSLVAVPLYTGVSIASDGLDAVAIEAFTLLEALKLMASVLCGETTGAETSKTIFKALGNNAVDRISSESDDQKNRTTVDTFI